MAPGFEPLFPSPFLSDGTLFEGVPTWLQQPLLAWIYEVAFREQSTPAGIARLEQFDRLTRQTDPLASRTQRQGLSNALLQWTDNDIIELTNFLIWDLFEHHPYGKSQWQTAADKLEVMLQEAGSAWKVVERRGAAGLEKRVSDGVAQAAERAMFTPDAGAALAKAWGHAFGRSPDASRAYGDAIRAVEEAAIPVVQAKHDKATLGTVIGQMKSDGDWALPIEHGNKLLIVEMCTQLWSGQTDRHGANNSHAPSQGAAESAVLLAVPLVQWFSSGQVQRR